MKIICQSASGLVDPVGVYVDGVLQNSVSDG
jgi:hypothetical protein